MQPSVLGAILLAVPQAVIFVDNSGQSGWVNHQGRRLLELSHEDSRKPEKISGAMRRLREAALNQEDIERRWRDSVHSPTSPILDWMWHFADDFPVQALNVSSVPTLDNDIQGRLWVFHDVSELFRAQKKLELTNEEVIRKNDELRERAVLLADARKEIEQQLETQIELTRLLESANEAFEYKNDLLGLANAELAKSNVRLVELNAEKNEIIGIVAHDLRNPVSAMRMTGEYLLENLGNTEEVKALSTQIVRSGNHVLSMISNLLDMNRLEEKAFRFVISDIDVFPILSMTVEQYLQHAGNKNITIQLYAEQESYIALADEQALMQVVDNLVSNAVKYSPHGKNISVRLQKYTNAVRIEVQDEGQGISPDEMKKLFGKFVRLSTRPTAGEHSTGLGLSIVKKMVEAMNGKVWCESEVGKGATFIVELPDNA